METLNLINETISVMLNAGKLVSLKMGSTEYMHGAEKPDVLKEEADRAGWRFSEIIMFPIVGPAANFTVNVGEETAYLDKHGIAREIPFVLAAYNDSSAVFEQRYKARTLVSNSKHNPLNENPAKIDWMFSYSLQKKVEVIDDHVAVTFTIRNEGGDANSGFMPYMLEWHPGFRMLGSVEHGIFSDIQGTYTLEDVLKASEKRAVSCVKYVNQETGKGVEVSSDNLNKMMIWCPSRDAGMFCIEPVTQLPAPGKENIYFLNNDFELLGSPIGEQCSEKSYTIRIKPLV